MFGLAMKGVICFLRDMLIQKLNQRIFSNSHLMILLLMMIANGWMTSWVKYDFDGGFETYAPLMIFIVAVHMVFAALGIVDRDAHHKFHDFSGWLGYSLVIFKFLLIGVYYYFYSFTKREVKKEQVAFFEQIVVIGLLYQLSDPVLILSIYLLPEWKRSFYFYVLDHLAHMVL